MPNHKKDHLSKTERAVADEAKKKFFEYLDSLPDVDLADPKVQAEIFAKIGEKIKPEIEAIDRDKAKRNGLGLFRVIY